MADEERFGRRSGDPTIASMLEDQIETLGNHLTQRLDQQDRAAADFKTETRQALGRIEGKVDKTNGRVTVLEKARERAQGVIVAFRWLPPTLTAILTAGLTILTLALTGAIK